MKMKVYASIDKEHLWFKGTEAGLKVKALEFFLHFNEVPLEIEVDEETGAVISCEAKLNE